MADFLTHILLADSVMERLESRRILEGVMKKRSLYYLGAQGPDPLFFYKCLPLSGKGPLMGLGHTLHRKKTGEFLYQGFKRLQNVSYDKGWMDLAIYLCGFICHFTLDRMIHPYVYWATNQWIWGMDGTPRQVTHQQVEMALDALLWNEYKGAPAYKVKTRKLIDIGPKWPRSIAEFYASAFLEVYGIEAEEKDLNNVLTDFYRGHDLLYDPRGWKRGLVSWLDGLTGGGIKPPKVPYPVIPDPDIDWANRKKRTWTNPFTGEGHTLSVDQLLSEVAHEAAVHLNTIFARMFKGEDIEDLFPDLSYDTGIMCVYDDKEEV